MDHKSLLDSSGLVGDAKGLRARADADGYLFIHQLFPPDQVDALRRAILKICAEAGWLAPATPIADGVAADDVRLVEGQPDFFQVYNKIQQLEEFHRLAHRREVIGLLCDLLGEEVLIHPRHICRIVFPELREYTTPPHQDYAVIGGATRLWTAWTPLGPCPTALGVLSILPGSHRQQLLPHHEAMGPGGRAVDLATLSNDWVAGDLQAGDALLFNTFTVHRAMPNRTDRLRLSMDIRYQHMSQPVPEDALLPHYGRLSWPEIYRDWRDTSLQYYWERQSITVSRQ